MIPQVTLPSRVSEAEEAERTSIRIHTPSLRPTTVAEPASRRRRRQAARLLEVSLGDGGVSRRLSGFRDGIYRL